MRVRVPPAPRLRAAAPILATLAATGVWAAYRRLRGGDSDAPFDPATVAHVYGPAAAAAARARAGSAPAVDALVVGGGVVGLAVARELAVRGRSVILLEKASRLVDGASSGNSGIGCTGYDAPAGSLERALLRRSILRHPNLYRSLGLSYNHIRKCGALVVAWTPDELAQLPHILEENLEAGDLESRLVGRAELREMEPSLGRRALGAVWAPREMVTEPWLVPIAFAHSALLHGAEIQMGQEVVRAAFARGEEGWGGGGREEGRSGGGGGGGGVWTVQTARGDQFRAQTVVNCAGLFGDRVDALALGDMPERPAFEIRPRKGQFVVFDALSGGGGAGGKATSVYVDGDEGTVGDDDDNDDDDDSGGLAGPGIVLQPVPTLRTKGVIVWKTVYGNVICGPTAEEQTSRTDRSNDAETIAMLKAHAVKVCPSLRDARVIGTYSGIRPATEHRDYQIKSIPAAQWITVGGIRSTGLTAASGIAEYVGALHDQMTTVGGGGGGGDGSLALETKEAVLPALGVDVLPPYLPSAAVSPAPVKVNPPAPTLAALAADFVARGDGTVTVFGKVWEVTHPLSSFGMATVGQQLRDGSRTREKKKKKKKEEEEEEEKEEEVPAPAAQVVSKHVSKAPAPVPKNPAPTSTPTSPSRLRPLPGTLSPDKTDAAVKSVTKRLQRRHYVWKSNHQNNLEATRREQEARDQARRDHN